MSFVECYAKTCVSGPVLSPWRSAFDAHAVQQAEPEIAQRRPLRHDEVLAELEARAAAGDDRRAVVERVARAEVAAVDERDVVEQARAVGFLGRLELVDQAGEQFALRGVAALRGVELFAEQPCDSGSCRADEP